uniref:Sorting nexin 19 n=1 Tax=Sus scrofa TaxID=9823 RepID=A0A8D0NCL1_PIG
DRSCPKTGETDSTPAGIRIRFRNLDTYPDLDWVKGKRIDVLCSIDGRRFGAGRSSQGKRWLEVQVANLTCPQRWVQYLRLLQESIWPGGVLPKYPRPVRTQEQKVAAEEQALQSLMGVLPDIVVEILGVNKCRLSWSLVLESLQQPLINRHLIYCLWDLILEFLDLSASVEESAMTTSASETPSNPKKMGISP